MNPGEIVLQGKRIARVYALVIVVLGEESWPGAGGDGNLIEDTGLIEVVSVGSGAIESKLGLIHQVWTEDVQQFEGAIDWRRHPLFQVRGGCRKRLRIDG